MQRKFLIPCECGEPFKLYLTAGKFSPFRGRAYYHCRLDRDECSIIWADDLLTKKFSHLHPVIAEDSEGLLDLPENAPSRNVYTRVEAKAPSYSVGASCSNCQSLKTDKKGKETLIEPQKQPDPVAQAASSSINVCNVSSNVNWDSIICCLIRGCTQIITVFLILLCLIIAIK